MKVTVIGAAGFVGGELLRLLISHPEVSRLRAISRSAAGKSWGDVHPGLTVCSDRSFESLSAGEASRGEDVVFLALEHGASRELIGELVEADPGLLIDLADDFRLPHPELPSFRYGLADTIGSGLRGERRIASPGCFATAALLALYPLSRWAPQAGAALWGITGSSGAGTGLKETTHHPRRATNVQAYSVLSHRHQREIEAQWWGWTGARKQTPRLMAHSGPFVRGIALTLHSRGEFAIDPRTALQELYDWRPFVKVLDAPPALNQVAGTNLAAIYGAVSADRQELQICVAIDNLIKGAGGQAVQSMNLALGLEETLGLPLTAAYPC